MRHTNDKHLGLPLVETEMVWTCMTSGLTGLLTAYVVHWEEISEIFET